jgi:Ca2+-binding RTX toxin-like protein
MQITLSKSFGTGTLGVPAVGDSLALYAQGGQGYLLYGADGTNGVNGLALGAVSNPGSGYMTGESLGSATFLSLQPGSGLTVQQSGSTTRLFSFESTTGALTVQTIGANGMPGAAAAASCNTGPLLGVTTFEILGGPTGSQAALSFYGQPGLGFYGLSASGALTAQTVLADTQKSYLGNVSDTLSVTVGGANYLLTLSSLEGGITSFSVNAQGQASLVDSLGTIDGLALAGAAAMQAVGIAGTTYVVIAATSSSSLTVARVNDMGCLFATDTVYDDRSTRFSHPEALDTFQWQGRDFIVTAGTDAGLTVMEMRPDGKLVPTAVGVFETGSGLGHVTAIEAAVSGNRVDFYVVDSGNQKIGDYQMDLSATGGMITAGAGTTTGTSLGDFLWGSAAAQTLNGGAGDDVIYDGAGADTLTGGAGADVFILAADHTGDRITDYQLHSDRIDLSDWGRVCSTSALTITPTSNGCTIAWGGESVTLVSATGGSLSAASFTDADFIFA